MNTECLRIADQLHRAFEGDAWHGPALREILSGVEEEHAASHGVAGVHSIWELVNHIETWERVALRAVSGIAMPKSMPPERDWPPISRGAWEAATNQLFATNAQLCHVIRNFQDARLHETVPGRSYDFYHLFHGMVQHGLYHAGQIMLLRKAIPVKH
jgi:DinB superfamily